AAGSEGTRLAQTPSGRTEPDPDVGTGLARSPHQPAPVIELAIVHRPRGDLHLRVFPWLKRQARPFRRVVSLGLAKDTEHAAVVPYEKIRVGDLDGAPGFVDTDRGPLRIGGPGQNDLPLDFVIGRRPAHDEPSLFGPHSDARFRRVALAEKPDFG